jgi:hypothetical protein
VYHLRPDGPFWRLTLETGRELQARLFDTKEKAVATALFLAERDRATLKVFRDETLIEADLDFRRRGG